MHTGDVDLIGSVFTGYHLGPGQACSMLASLITLFLWWRHQGVIAGTREVINTVIVIGGASMIQEGNVKYLLLCLSSHCWMGSVLFVWTTTALIDIPSWFWTSSNPAIALISSGYLAQVLQPADSSAVLLQCNPLCLESKKQFNYYCQWLTHYIGHITWVHMHRWHSSNILSPASGGTCHIKRHLA